MALRAAISRRVVNRPSWLYGTRSISSPPNLHHSPSIFLADPNPNLLFPRGLGASNGIYRKPEFAGNLNTVVREDEKRTAFVKSQLQQLFRPMYRNPSVCGPLIGSPVLGKSFSLANIRTTHSQAGVASGNGEFSAKLRPLSPHLTVYKPQSTSTSSIFHRIAYIYMGVAALFYYLLYLKMGMICFTYEKFYQFFYYSSELFPIINEISVVALAYYVYKGAEQFIKFR